MPLCFMHPSVGSYSKVDSFEKLLRRRFETTYDDLEFLRVYYVTDFSFHASTVGAVIGVV